jgi:putative DNA primase/helicase
MTKQMRDVALAAVQELNLPVFPCHSGNAEMGKMKTPLVKGGFHAASKEVEQIEKWWSVFPDAVIGVPTGSVSNIVAVDIDIRENKNGENTLTELGMCFDGSWQTKTPTGGRHIFFKHPGFEIKNKAGNFLGPGIDFRGDGGYVIFCGSKTAAGDYSPIDGCNPFNSALQSMPDLLLKHMPQRELESTEAKRSLFEGERNVGIFKLANKLLETGMQGDQLLQALKDYNQNSCIPPIENSEVQTIFNSASKQNHERMLPLTDLGNSERFIKCAAGKIFYCPENGNWVGPLNGTYQQSETLPYENAKVTIRAISSEIVSANNPQNLLKWAKNSQSVTRIDAMIKLAQKDKRIARRLADMDVEDEIINIKNGAFDLDRNELLVDRGSRFLTKQANVSFNPEADCPRWKSFLNEITDDDPEVITQLQKAIGYTLSGNTDAQLFFVCTGSGANGKSVLLEVINYLMGSYSGKINATTLTGSAPNKIPNELAALTGKRFITVSEMPIGQIINTTTLKELTGQDTVSARFLYKEFFELKPKFKIWIATNRMLEFTENSHALHRRMVTFEFPIFFAQNERDPKLLQKLKDESDGIFNWALDGYKIFQDEGFGEINHHQHLNSWRTDSEVEFDEFFNKQLIHTSNLDSLPLNRIIEKYRLHLGMRYAGAILRRNVKQYLQKLGYLPERIRQGDKRTVVMRGLQERELPDTPF